MFSYKSKPLGNQDHELRARALEIVASLRIAIQDQGMIAPACTTIIQEYGRDPYLVLISCLLSLRTKDTVSLPASRRLFAIARTPAQMLALSQESIEQLIYPVGFYRQKAKSLRDISSDLIHRFAGLVPFDEQDLLSLKGVGRKTANLVRGEGFLIPAICVDVHVHRISNRLGLVSSKTPEETEQQLKLILPQELWIEYNKLLVMWGQNTCVPVTPFCRSCPVRTLCEQRGVTRIR